MRHFTLWVCAVCLAVGGCPTNGPLGTPLLSTDTGVWSFVVSPPPPGTIGNLTSGGFEIKVEDGRVIEFADQEAVRIPGGSSIVDAAGQMVVQWTVDSPWYQGEWHTLTFVLQGTQASDGSYQGHGELRVDGGNSMGMFFLLQPI